MPEKIGRDDFFGRKTAFFLKNMCFQQPRRWYGNDLRTCTMVARIPFGPLQTVPWSFSYSIKRQNVGRKSFFGGK